MRHLLSLRDFLWPVRNSEKRAFYLAFCILYLLGVADLLVRTLHDALLLTGTPNGAEALPFIDFWLVLPSAILATAVYSWLSRHISLDRLFILIVSVFLLFFMGFAFILYPARAHFEAPCLAAGLQELLSTRFQGLIAAIHYWPITLFYVVTALWKPLIIVVLFWGLLNRVASVEQASRLYGPLMLSHSLAGFTGGQLSILVHHTFAVEALSQAEAWTKALQFMIVIVTLLGMASIWLYQRVRLELPDDLDRPPGQPDKTSPSLFQSVALIIRSPYLMGIILFLLADNIAYVLMQPVWKYHLSQLYPNPLDFVSYNGKLNTCTACVTALLALGVTGQVIRRLGWTVAAMINPLVLLATSCSFFFFIIARDSSIVRSMAGFWGTTPVAAGVFCGAVCECLSRSCKYTLVDTTKELAFVPLDSRTQNYAKAAIDGVGGRLGKAAGSLLQQGILICSMSIGSSAAPTALLMFCFVVIAIQAARATGQRFYRLNEGLT